MQDMHRGHLLVVESDQQRPGRFDPAVGSTDTNPEVVKHASGAIHSFHWCGELGLPVACLFDADERHHVVWSFLQRHDGVSGDV